MPRCTPYFRSAQVESQQARTSTVVAVMGLEKGTIVSRARDESGAARHALIMSGLSAEEATHWCAAWEAEAERQTLHPDSRYFWDAGRGWIDAQRSFLGRRTDARVAPADPSSVAISRRQ